MFLEVLFTFALAQTAAEIVKKADDIRIPPGDVVFDIQVDDFKGPRKLRTNGYQVKARGAEATMVDTTFPERNKGRKLLMVKNNLWFYAPDVRRPTRLSMQQRLTGEVANGDIARMSFAEDYEPTLNGTEKVGNKNCHKITLTALRKDVTYSKIEYWVEVGTFQPVKAIYFATSGKKLKVGVFSDYRKYDGGVLRPGSQTITDAIDPTKKSVMIVKKMSSTKHPDAIFNKDALAN